MPFPGSQKMNSIEIAYILYTNRWLLRIVFLLCILSGSFPAFKVRKKWIPVCCILLACLVIYQFNFVMKADRLFLQPEKLEFKSLTANCIPDHQLVIGAVNNGIAKAYPISFLIYHHQICDQIGGKPIIATYCSVCRSGRIFESEIDGRQESFRLVGMDHFNAMFEDSTTKSWWRQATGEAIIGPRKGKRLNEMNSQQMTVEKWFELHPLGLVMQADEHSLEKYDSLALFEKGKGRSKFTRTDSIPWQDKSWVAALQLGRFEKAYDWNDLKNESIINDRIGPVNIMIAISADCKSFVAYERPSDTPCKIDRNDLLLCGNISYRFTGENISDTTNKLKPIQVYQEFWGSWQTFHPNTEKYIVKNISQ